MSRLVTCVRHPGTHLQTPKCVNSLRESAGHRLARWLESKLNPKQGREGPTCSACGNELIGPGDRCEYCGENK